MIYAARMDEFRGWGWHRRGWSPVAVVFTILGFIIFWPIGLAILAFMIGSGRMGCWNRHDNAHWQRKFDRLQEKAERWCRGHGRTSSTSTSSTSTGASSGNRAFDEYRDETLRRLEDEQREFHEFLDRLRHAKDKAEFDEFMAERRRRPSEEPPSAEPGPQPA